MLWLSPRDGVSCPNNGKGNDDHEPRANPRKRWFQFGLSTLLALTALAAVGAMAFRVYVEPYRRQRGTMALIEKLGGRYETVAADGWLRTLFGEDFQNVNLVDLAPSDARSYF